LDCLVIRFKRNQLPLSTRFGHIKLNNTKIIINNKKAHINFNQLTRAFKLLNPKIAQNLLPFRQRLLLNLRNVVPFEMPQPGLQKGSAEQKLGKWRAKQ